jgi:DNA polymerase-1
MNKINPKSVKIIMGIPPKLSKEDRCACDSEWYRMQEGKLHRPTGTFACATFTIDGKTVYVVTDPKDIKKSFQNIEPAVLIFHNAKFDVFHLRRLTDIPMRKRLWDTMLIEQIMYSGWFDSFRLSDLARRRLDIYLDKTEQEGFVDSDTMSKEQIVYAAIDAVATWRIYKSQRAEIEETDLNVWKNIDLRALWVILSMSGQKLDKTAWTTLAKKNQKRLDSIAKKYPKINLGSWQQVLKEVHRLGYKKITKTGEDYLKPYKDECKFIADVLEYRGLGRAVSTYGMNFLETNIEEDDRVYSDFRVIGAATGRVSSSNPNMENIPIKDTREFRDCFIADEDNILVDADWSAQEPRIFAYLSDDEKLKEIFVNKQDVYIACAKLMFGWNLKKTDPRRKERMKPTVLGASYGLTEYGMEQKYGIPKGEGKELLEKFWETFPEAHKWKLRQQKIRTFVQTVYGRKYWLNTYQWGWENNCLNSPIQGAASDAMKIAAHKFLEKWGGSSGHNVIGMASPIVNLVHDEILLEVPKTMQSVAEQLLRESMIETAEEMTPGIPSEVEIKSASNWGEAHG